MRASLSKSSVAGERAWIERRPDDSFGAARLRGVAQELIGGRSGAGRFRPTRNRHEDRRRPLWNRVSRREGNRRRRDSPARPLRCGGRGPLVPVGAAGQARERDERRSEDPHVRYVARTARFGSRAPLVLLPFAPPCPNRSPSSLFGRTTIARCTCARRSSPTSSGTTRSGSPRRGGTRCSRSSPRWRFTRSASSSAPGSSTSSAARRASSRCRPRPSTRSATGGSSSASARAARTSSRGSTVGRSTSRCRR